MKKVATLALSALVLAVPHVASAAPRTFKELADLIVSIIDTGTGLLILAGIVVYFWGISTNLLKMRDESGQAFKAYFVWGIIAIFVMVSIWGIIELLQNTLFGGDTGGFTQVSTEDPNFVGSNGFPTFE